jgi:hypothetical protein
MMTKADTVTPRSNPRTTKRFIDPLKRKSEESLLLYNTKKNHPLQWYYAVRKNKLEGVAGRFSWRRVKVS